MPPYIVFNWVIIMAREQGKNGAIQINRRRPLVEIPTYLAEYKC
jgi:hypothetical protein